MRKAIVVVLLVSLLLLVGVSTAYSELTNGGFEDGDFTGWTTDEPGIVCGTCGGEAVVENAAAYTGLYGLRLNGSVTFPDQNYDGVAQRIPVDFGSITIKYNVIESTGAAENNNIYCYLVTDEGNWFEVFDEVAPFAGGWTEVTLTKAEIETLNGYSDWGASPDVWIMVEARTAAIGASTSVFTVYVDDINPPVASVASSSTLVLELIALCFLFLLASIWSEENVRFGYVLVPLAAAFFVWAGFLPFAYLTTVIPLMIFMGIFSFMRMQAKYKWGFMGTSGGILYKIVFFLIMIQMVIGYVNGMGIFATNSVVTPDDQFTGYTLTSAQSVYGANSYGIDVVDMITNGLKMTWMAFKVLWSMLSAVFFIYPTLVNQFMVPVELSLVIQAGIYVIYGLELFNMIYKPFKAAEV